jgi:hypothetical protein
MRRALWLALLASFFVSVSLPVLAQKYTGALQGTVTDPSGAVIGGADVTAKNAGTGATRTANSGGEGTYSFPDLPVGIYEVTVRKSGFKEFVSKGVEVHVSSVYTLNAALQLGNASETMEVEANAVQVETASGAVGNVVEGHEVRELPLNGRSFVQLTQLMPGVSPQANFDSKNKGLMSGVDFSVNGNYTTGNLYLVDGVNNNDIGSNRTILVYPSIDAISEFKILRNSYGPEYGQAMGAIVSLVTRSGTNQFHGSAFYSGRNDKLNATDYFNNLNKLPKDVLRRNDWGYTFGGPIVKDKLFFFWEEEWNHEIRGKIRRANVPTVAEKGGDFSALRVASDGSACENTPSVAGAAATAIPAGQQSAAGLALVQLFPDPNLPTSQVIPGDCSNWAQSFSSPIYWRQENIRGDFKIAPTWALMARYTHDAWSQPFPSTLNFWGEDRYPSVEGSWLQPGSQATAKLTKLFGSTAVNDFQVSYAANRITVTRAGTDPGLNDQINKVLRSDYPVDGKLAKADMGHPLFWGGLGNGANSDNLWTQAPWHNNEQLLILKDDFSKVVGTHTFKVGFLATNNQKNEVVNNSSAENVQFSNVDGKAGPDSTNGTFNALWNQTIWSSSELQTNPFSQVRWHDYELYYGDTWRLRRNLTLEYGIRWSFLRQPYSGPDKIANFVPSAYDPALGSDPCNGIVLPPDNAGACQAAGFLGGRAGPNRALKENDNHAIAPRIGIAWDPRGDGKMSLRAGVGQFFQRERVNNWLGEASNPPFALTATGAGVERGLDTPANPVGSGSPSLAVDPGSALANTWQWNFTLERELRRDSKLELAYVGNKSLHSMRYNDINAVPVSQRLAYALDNSNLHRPFSNFGQINFAQWAGSANYHALQALYRQRIKALDAQFAYTWSKSLSDTDPTNSGGASQTTVLLDPFNPRLNYGPSLINRPHTFVGNVIYDLPRFTGQSGFVRQTLGGWQLATILDYASGPSLTIYANGGVNGASGGFSGTGARTDAFRPLRVAGQSCRAPSRGPAGTQWLNPNAWTLQGYQLTTFPADMAPVGQCYGPGLANTDFSVHKNFRASERITLQFRMDFFNFFNKTQFRPNSQGFNGVDTNLIGNNPHLEAATNTVIWNPATDEKTTFGQVLSDRGPREIQYQLKIEF